MPHCCWCKQHSLSQLHLSRSPALRQPLVDNGSTNDIAAQLLTAIWNTQHTIDCQHWQAQVDADTAAENACRMQHKREKETQRRSRESVCGIWEGKMEKEQGEIHTHSKSTYSLSTTSHHQHLCLEETSERQMSPFGTELWPEFRQPDSHSSIQTLKHSPLSKTTTGAQPSLPLSPKENPTQSFPTPIYCLMTSWLLFPAWLKPWGKLNGQRTTS